jgi:exopolysaccharide biosynthesis polyprenyl glycosylphosphotransferase
VLAAADVLSAALATALAVLVLGEDDLGLIALAPLPLVVLIGKVIGLYDRDEHLLHKTTLDETPALFHVATLYTLLMWLGEGWLVRGELGHMQVLVLWGLLLTSMVAVRGAARRTARSIAPAERCLVIGDEESAERVRVKLESTAAVKAKVVGRVPFEHPSVRSNGRPRGSLLPVAGSVETLGVTLAEREVERVVIAPGTSDSDEILDQIRLVKSLGVKVSVLPRLFEVVGSSVEFDEVHGLTLLGLPTYGLTKSSLYLKRGMDVAGAVVGLAALAPLFAVIAVAVKLSSPGRVFYRQVRIGRDGGAFNLFKFRTMVHGADAMKAELHPLNEADGLFKIADDPRVTRVGRFLRRSCLDELPQLVNVLRGEMSLVGPRPLVADEDSRVSGWHRSRLNLKPGMTGLWQIFGSSRIPLQEMVKIDYLYTANWSLWGDVKTLLRTVPHVLARRGL